MKSPQKPLKYDTFAGSKVAQEKNHPEEKSSCFSRYIFSWVFPLVKICNERKLMHQDVWGLRETFKCRENLRHLLRHHELHRSVLRSILRAFWPLYLELMICTTLFVLVGLVVPLLLNNVLQLLEKDTIDINAFLPPCLSFLFIISIISVVMLRMTYIQNIVSLRPISSLQGLIYQSAVLSHGVDWNSGDIVNLFSTDCYNITHLSTMLTLPLQLIGTVGTVFQLFGLVGPASFAGIASLLVVICCNHFCVVKPQQKFYSAAMKVKDDRLSVLYETFSNIEIVKLNAWGEKLRSKCLLIRDNELAMIWRFFKVLAGSKLLLGGSQTLAAISTFGTYTLVMGYQLTASTVFTSITLFSMLQGFLLSLPMSISSIVQVCTSIKRLNTYFDEVLSEELLEAVIADGIDSVTATESEQTTEEYAVSVKQGQFSWSIESPAVLDAVEVSIQEGELIVVHGKSGSGKSSLCGALTGNMIRLSGERCIRGRVAYCSQEAWLFNDTIRENIVFSNAWDPEKYARVLQCCALTQDLDLFPRADLTVVTEKGGNLSGGLKARVSLARACYADADVYVLDSPLAALDSIVRDEVFRKCILGLLRSKTRILVTHSPNIIASKYAHGTIEMRNGLVMARRNGKFESDVPRDLLCSPKTKGTPVTPLYFPPAVVSTASKMALDNGEDSEDGKVSNDVYRLYLNSAGGWRACVLVILGQILQQTLKAFSDIWLSLWSSNISRDGNSTYYLTVYSALGMGGVFMGFLIALAVAYCGVQASRKLFDRMLSSLLKAPLNFFSKNPTGRQMNRFTDDTMNMDFDTSTQYRDLLSSIFQLVSMLVVVTFATGYMGLFALCLFFVVLRVFLYFLQATRQLQRLMQASVSPVLSNLTESMDGSAVLNAYGMPYIVPFIRKNEDLIDKRFSYLYAFVAAMVMLNAVASLLLNIFQLIILVSVFSLHNVVPVGVSGLLITYGMGFLPIISSAVSAYASIELKMVSLERINQYIQVEPETQTGSYWSSNENDAQNGPGIELQSTKKDDANSHWPSEGNISFRAVSLSFLEEVLNREDNDNRSVSKKKTVLNNISLDISAREKIGIVGRTGAGKSSLVKTLFRLSELDSGSIHVDGIDISSIHLEMLRRNLSIIPQSPVLITGSLRDFLDPFQEHDDVDLWSCLRKVCLAKVVESSELKLHTALSSMMTAKSAADDEETVGATGLLRSVGERQLLSIARALLSNSRIVVMDEATAYIDHETEKILQDVIHRELKDCTVLTIAHRLDTIMNCDKILLLDEGEIVEFAPTAELLSNPDSKFNEYVLLNGSKLSD